MLKISLFYKCLLQGNVSLQSVITESTFFFYSSGILKYWNFTPTDKLFGPSSKTELYPE